MLSRSGVPMEVYSLSLKQAMNHYSPHPWQIYRLGTHLVCSLSLASFPKFLDYQGVVLGVCGMIKTHGMNLEL